MNNHSCLKWIFSCCSDTQESDQTINRITSLYKFYGKPKHQCVAIQTLHNFTLKKPFEKLPNKSNELYQQFINRHQLNQDELISLIPYITIPNYKLTINDDQLKFTLPYCVMNYLAKRITNFTKHHIVDLFSAPGILSIQLAQLNVQLLQSFVQNLQEQDDVENNISQFYYYSKQKQDVLIYQLQELKQKPDVIILQTLHLKQLFDSKEYFDKLNSLFQPIVDQTANIVVILPSNIEIDDICSYLSPLMHKNEYSFRKIEVEKINLCGHPLCSILYIGFIGDEETLNQQIKQCYLQELMNDQPTNVSQNLNRHFQQLEQIINKVGYYQTMLLIEKVNAEQTTVDYKINLFYSLVSQIHSKIKDQIDPDLYFIQQTPSLNHPLLQSTISKKSSQFRLSNDIIKSQTFNTNKTKVFSFKD